MRHPTNKSTKRIPLPATRSGARRRAVPRREDFTHLDLPQEPVNDRLAGSPVPRAAREAGVASGGILNRDAPARRKPLRPMPGGSAVPGGVTRAHGAITNLPGRRKPLRPLSSHQAMSVPDGKPSDLIRRDGESADAFLRRASERFPQSASDNQDQVRTAISGLLADGDTTALLRQRALNGLERDAARTGMPSAEFLRRAQAIREAVPSSIPKDATKVAALPLPIFWLITYGMPLVAGSLFLQQNRDRLVPRGFVTPGPEDTPEFPSSGFMPETVETDPERFPGARGEPRENTLKGPNIQPAGPTVHATPDHSEAALRSIVLEAKSDDGTTANVDGVPGSKNMELLNQTLHLIKNQATRKAVLKLIDGGKVTTKAGASEEVNNIDKTGGADAADAAFVQAVNDAGGTGVDIDLRKDGQARVFSATDGTTFVRYYSKDDDESVVAHIKGRLDPQIEFKDQKFAIKVRFKE